jgi:membrane peptidoglycan carboxypeptidase
MVDLAWGRLWHRDRRRGGGWGFAFLRSVRLLRWLAVIVAGVLIGWGVSLEMRTSYLQSRIFSRLSRQMTYTLEPGASHTVVFPSWGPYNDRLGYVGLPSYIDSLKRHGFAVARQARWSQTLQQFVKLGFYPPYTEKQRAGLQLYDRNHNPIYTATFPQRSYPDFKTIPPLVANSLLFIEDHDLLAPGDRERDPAVEWKRFLLAIAGRAGGWFNRHLREGGASTLATQIEKFRHSPDGQTPSPREKLRQMVSAAISAYHNGTDTTEARRHTVTTYLNSTPLGSWPGYGEVIGLPEALWVWYGTELADADRILLSPARTPAELARKGTVYRQVLSLLLADRRPAYYLGNHQALEQLTDRYLNLAADSGLISPRLRAAALASRLRFRTWMRPAAVES